jgi:hypothetical protein
MVVCCALLALWAAPTAAQEDQQMSLDEELLALFDAATTSTKISHRVYLETLSCGEFVSIATSNDDNDVAVAGMLMVWAHGYYSGLKGPNFEAQPVSMAGMSKLVNSAIAECRAHPDMLFHVALTKVE